ncbi:hypothetical protein [Asticcacaulis benevestitus]|uniref:Uncharacterized protein n=1 Tax=Asticcacaulis benevestitus DSM 16100 = ATCC BAA-896 TaxID=1121022 RepID=V4RCQ3_9CAUL|nr:hypothetical protein [Asticcacaulis benevestitus]ESQ89173.1 hypothetical protein ABENE_14460 [Asticcacaulis benevestitus DSM 16100 = ATCC BAA-896]
MNDFVNRLTAATVEGSMPLPRAANVTVNVGHLRLLLESRAEWMAYGMAFQPAFEPAVHFNSEGDAI